MAAASALRSRCAAAVASILMASGASGAVATGVPVLQSASIRSHGHAVEMHFDFVEVAPRWTLTAHGSELWLDFDRMQIGVPVRPFYGSEVAPVAAVRVVDRGNGRARIAVEVSGRTDYAVGRLPHEIVLRVAYAGAEPNLAAPILVRNEDRASYHAPEPLPSTAKPATPAPAKQVASAGPMPSAPKIGAPLRATPPIVAVPALPLDHAAAPPVEGAPHLVMIDPGHGGYDPGTISASGIQEKDLALEIATRFKRQLETRGMRAELTRSSDVFVALGERTRLANRADAELFVSIHMNSSPNSDTTGIEVYYLNNTTDRATIRLAKMENGSAPAPYGTTDGANLNYILADLNQEYKATEAASVARMIDAQTVADLEAGMGVQVNALGAKMGPFWVLVGAHMPAVLVECGFLSNSGEASRLRSAQYQEILADGIATAIQHYFNADAAVGNL